MTLTLEVAILLDRGGVVAQEQTSSSTLLNFSELPLVIEAVGKDGQVLGTRVHLPAEGSILALSGSGSRVPIPFPMDDEVQITSHFSISLSGRWGWRKLQDVWYFLPRTTTLAVSGDSALTGVISNLLESVEPGAHVRLAVAATPTDPLIVDRCWG